MIKVFTITFFFFISKNILAQPIQNLALEGAGIRGLAYCGTIKALEETKILPQIKRISGTSAGAITAMLISIGYTANEIETIIGSTNFAKFNDGGFPFLGGLHRLVKNYGWYKGNKFEKWLGKLIATKTTNENITFLELQKKYKSLYITGTSLSTQQTIVFSAENFPNMPVRNAIRISMSIPMYYKAVIMDEQGNFYKTAPKNLNYHVMVDGGFLQNLPIKVFDSTKYFSSKTINEFNENPFTVGIRVDSKNQIDLDKNKNYNTIAPLQIKSFGDYGNAFIVFITEHLNRQQLTAKDWERTISISDGGIGPKIKKMPKADKELLIKNGYNATMAYLKKQN